MKNSLDVDYIIQVADNLEQRAEKREQRQVSR